LCHILKMAYFKVYLVTFISSEQCFSIKHWFLKWFKPIFYINLNIHLLIFKLNFPFGKLISRTFYWHVERRSTNILTGYARLNTNYAIFNAIGCLPLTPREAANRRQGPSHVIGEKLVVPKGRQLAAYKRGTRRLAAQQSTVGSGRLKRYVAE